MIISEIHIDDSRCQRKFDNLLANEGIRRDPWLDYIVGVFDNDYNLLAAGACFANTLRCLAVDSAHRCEGLMEKVVTALVYHQLANGRTQLFLYTKRSNASVFASLGFHEVAHANEVILMENRKNGFDSFLRGLGGVRQGRNAALVMNCNPFTLGHRFLVEKAAAENDNVHLFVVSEDLSCFPFADRYELVRTGCADLSNVVLHQTGSYMISAAVFPSYFLQDEGEVVAIQAELDSSIFLKIAAQLDITRRYLGEEPFSATTNMYNDVLREKLPLGGVECRIVARKEHGSLAISASRVRALLQEGQIERVAELVPKTTMDYLLNNDAMWKSCGEKQ